MPAAAALKNLLSEIPISVRVNSARFEASHRRVQPLTKEPVMNQDQVKGNIKDTAGKLQQKAGEVLGNDKQQAKGDVKQAEGKIQKAVGNIKDTFGK